VSKRSIYFSSALEAIIGIEEDSAESLSGRVSYLVMLADRLVREQMPELTSSEWGAIVDANMNTLHQYNLGIETVLSGLWHNLYDFAHEGDEKWGVDCEALSKRMKAMPLGAQAAVFEISKQFWQRVDEVNAAGDYAAAFNR
jgi:hypothetical protein